MNAQQSILTEHIMPRLRSGSLCFKATYIASERGTPVGEEHEGEVPRAVGRGVVGTGLSRLDSVLPHPLVLDGERGKSGAEEVAVEPWIVVPPVNVRVGEYHAVDGRHGVCFEVRRVSGGKR